MNILVADVGGTYWTTAIIDTESGDIRYQQRVHTHEITTPEAYVNHFLEQSTFKATHACFAVAGPVFGGEAKLTNADLKFSVKKLTKNTPLQKVMLINDFAALGLGINTLAKKDRRILRGKARKDEPAVLIGAGTGLGKAFLVPGKNGYAAYAGEGAHAPLPAENEEELQLVTFLKHKHKTTATYHDVLSGAGLENLYEFFAHQSRPAPDIMSISDAHTRDAIRLFKKYYARFAKAAVLDLVATGGLYIAGGIATHNPQLFDKLFIKEFEKGAFSKLLEDIPIILITHNEVSLRGAALALSKEL